MHRRDFLMQSAFGAVLGATGARAVASPVPATAPPRGWAAIKAEFDLAPDLAHMTGFFLASHPRVVREAIERHRRGLDQNPLEYLDAHLSSLERGVRAAAARYLGVDADEIAVTDSTTMGLGVVYGGVTLGPGQEILSTTHDHLATTLACRHRVERTGHRFRQVALYDDPARASAGAIARALARAIRPETRIVAGTWVHSGTGVKLPIRALADVVAAANRGRTGSDRVLLCVDAVHGFGLEDAGPRELGCDVFITGCHKWLFGPRGTGLVWATREAWAALTPSIPSFDPMWRDPGDMPRAGLLTPGGFHAFEHRWALEPAFAFASAIGRSAIAERTHTLADALKRGLARVPGVTVHTPAAAALSAGIVCFSVDGKTPKAVVAALRERGIVASVTPPFYAPAYVRLAPSLLTVEADVERSLAAVRSL